MKESNNQLPIGTVLDSGVRKYRIEAVLGQGGFGITYKATGRVKVGNIEGTFTFAIKEHFIRDYNERQGTTVTTPNSSNVTKVNDSIKAFLSEATRLNRLSLKHPGIVKVNENFRANGTAYYVMEYIEGESLRHHVEHHAGGRLPEAEAVSIIRQVGKSVQYLHDNRVNHLDIKPDNILLRTDGQPVLIDFGLSKHYDRKGRATSTLKVAGTSDGYSPLEQYAGLKNFSPQADVYALAATLLFMLTGKDPKEASDIRPADIKASLEPSASAATASAVIHAMSMLKENRTASVNDFLAELEEGGMPIDDNDDKPDYLGKPTVIIDPKPKSVPTPKPSPFITLLKRAGALIKPGFLKWIGAISQLIYEENEDNGDTEMSGSSYDESKTGTENGHEWVDLGLSVRWATMNVGATSPEDYGGNFAWGETEPKNDYSWSTYKCCKGSYGSMTKYCTDSGYGTVDNRTVLERSDDVASVKWGGNWRMPTYDELNELNSKCTWTWTIRNGYKGYKVKGPNGNSIFLPAAGYRYGTSLSRVRSYGSYWSSSLYATRPYDARSLYFYSSDHDMSRSYRYFGQSVRPVSEP